MSTREEPITAIVLGNPTRPRRLDPPFPNEVWTELGFSYDGGDGDACFGSSTFSYQADDERYDTGFIIIVRYDRNDDEPDCVENEALNEPNALDLMTMQDKVLPSIDKLLPVNNLILKTVNGSPVITSNEDLNDIPYPLIPEKLSIPRVSISLLRKCPRQIFHNVVDIVTISGDPDNVWYAFKRYMIPWAHEPLDFLLSEVEHLDGIQTPYVIKPAFLVTDISHSRFRGYLTPFLPGGTLRDVLTDPSGDRDPEEMDPEPLVLGTKASQASSAEATQVSDEPVADKSLVPTRILGWALKHTWSIEATSGIVALHDNGTYSGDIKLDNILLGRDGHLQLIDVAPQQGYTEQYVPPELDLSGVADELPLTEARDVFALGLVLWQIAEEIAHFHREDIPAVPSLVWGEGQGSTLQWYRDLVESCLEDADRRPSARHVLEVLCTKNGAWS